MSSAEHMGKILFYATSFVPCYGRASVTTAHNLITVLAFVNGVCFLPYLGNAFMLTNRGLV